MPRKQAAPNSQQTPEYQLTVKLINVFRQAWLEQMKESGVSQVTYSRLSVVAMTQTAAVAAVDVGMTREQYTAVCGANYDEAYKAAPKFA